MEELAGITHHARCIKYIRNLTNLNMQSYRISSPVLGISYSTGILRIGRLWPGPWRNAPIILLNYLQHLPTAHTTCSTWCWLGRAHGGKRGSRQYEAYDGHIVIGG